jgi:hypothetical protein
MEKISWTPKVVESEKYVDVLEGVVMRHITTCF